MNIDGQTCVLTIADGSSTTKTMTPAENPFTTSMQEDDDIFTPIRTGNGYVRVVVDKVSDVADLVGSAPLSRSVELKVAGTTRWIGFLACETFTQAWDTGPLELDLPVVSPLEVAKGLNPSSSLNELSYISFAAFIYNLNEALGSPFNKFYFPVLSNTGSTLRYLFDLRNYATAEDKNVGYEMESYYDILEDICKLFGWQAVEYEKNLMFLATDDMTVDSTYNCCYKGYTTARLLQLVSGANTNPTDTPAFTQTRMEVYGADHSMTYVPGKKSVKVTGQLNERTETIWSMDVVDQCVFKGSDIKNETGSTLTSYAVKKYGAYKSEGLSTPNGNICAYNSVNGINNVDEGGNNIKFLNFKNGNDDLYGGSIAYEKMYKMNSTSHEISQGSNDYETRLILKPQSSTSTPNTVFRIRTNFHYVPTQNAGSDAFKIKGTVMYANDRTSIFEKASGRHYTKAALIVTDGTNTYYWSAQNGWSTTSADFLIVSEDGEICTYGYVGENSSNFVANIPAPSVSGEVQLLLIAQKDAGGESWPDSGYIAYEGLEIELYSTSGRGKVKIENKEQRDDENVNKETLANGFTEEWSQDCGLTLAREAVPDCYGVVLSPDKTLPESLYSSKFPEKAMADRAVSRFAYSHIKLKVEVKSAGKLLSPFVPYYVHNVTEKYICVEQQMDWRMNRVTCGLF